MRFFCKVLSLAVIFSMIFALFSCVPPTLSDGEYYAFTDDLGREVKLDKVPSRVAVLFSSYAEIWQLAGGEALITVGDSVERGFAEEDAILVDGGAGHTTLDVETLVAASPDFVIGTADYPVQVEACELLASYGIPTALFRVEAFDDYLRVLRVFTDILGTEEKYAEHGTAVKAQIDGYFEAVFDYLEVIPDGEKKMLFMRAGSSPRSTKAKRAEDHFACAMLEELGLSNIADTAPVLLDGLSEEEIVIADPEYIFVAMMGEDEEAVKSNANSILSGGGYAKLSAVAEGRVEFLPKSLFHYKPNHRWADAYLYLIELLYPEVEI